MQSIIMACIKISLINHWPFKNNLTQERLILRLTMRKAFLCHILATIYLQHCDEKSLKAIPTDTHSIQFLFCNQSPYFKRLISYLASPLERIMEEIFTSRSLFKTENIF